MNTYNNKTPLFDPDAPFEIDINIVEPTFQLLPENHYKVEIIDAKIIHIDYMSKPPFNGTGKALTLIYSVFGNDNPSHNGKLIYQNIPLDGVYKKVTLYTLRAIYPDSNTNKFVPKDMIGKCLEVKISYKVDKKTGIPRKFPNVDKVFPLIGHTGNIGSIDIEESEIPF